jgi:hypothetical protein
MLFKLFDDFEKKPYLEVLGEYGLPVKGDYWWTRFPKRAVDEIFAMRKNTKATLIQCDEKLIWQESITNNFDSRFYISIETNESFPHKMPKVFVKEPWINPSNTIHIYSDGTLCLMHPSSYNSRISILEIRNLAAAWCFCYDVFSHTGTWPAAEHHHIL